MRHQTTKAIALRSRETGESEDALISVYSTEDNELLFGFQRVNWHDPVCTDTPPTFVWESVIHEQPQVLIEILRQVLLDGK